MNEHPAKQVLLQRRADLLGIKRDFSIVASADDLERLEHLNLLDIEARLAEGDTARIKQIDAALQRIESGEYGDCSRCGKPISPARLKALPEAARCAPCQERTERRNA